MADLDFWVFLNSITVDMKDGEYQINWEIPSSVIMELQEVEEDYPGFIEWLEDGVFESDDIERIELDYLEAIECYGDSTSFTVVFSKVPKATTCRVAINFESYERVFGVRISLY